jgi:hypothetical protein
MTGTVRALVLAISLALGLAGSANAAAPRLITVDGKSLEGQVLISDAEDVFELYQAFFEGQAVDRSALMGRQSLRLGLFWDDRLWEPYVQEGRLGQLRFKQANQVGRFYPATDGQPALVDLPAEGRWPRTAKGTALRVLETHDVPFRVGARTTGRVWVWAAVGGVGLASLGVGVFLARRVRRVGGPPDTASA